MDSWKSIGWKRNQGEVVMFRIGLIEAGLTCAVVTLILLVPLMIARINQRLKSIENKLDKKK